MNISELVNKSEQAIEYLDSFEAWKILKLWKIFLQENFQGTGRNVSNNFQKTVLDLKIVAFPNLEDEECANFLESNVLEFFRIEASLENLLTEKLFLVPYSIRDSLRKTLRSAILRNSERIGQLTIGSWLSKFDQTFNPAERDESAVINFINMDANAVSMPISSKELLKKILHAYDYLLVYTLPETGEELEEHKRMYLSGAIEGSTGNRPPLYSGPANRNVRNTVDEVNYPVSEALSRFPKLGEQLITSFLIKIKSFDRPVRPSIRNWLYDYTSHLGQTGHSSMDRTNYLFRSVNAMNLSSPEREKLSIILRSFDENIPLPVDAGRQEVVFDDLLKKVTSQAPSRQASSQPKAASSINFIHHIERHPVQSGNAAKPETVELKQKAAPEIFINPYQKIRPQEIGNGLNNPPRTFSKPEAPRNVPSPAFPSRDFQKAQNSPGSTSGEMKFANPYPSPGTHESKFEQKNDNIANVSFSEGIPRVPVARVSVKKIPEMRSVSSTSIPPKTSPPAQNPAPAPKTARPSYHYAQPDRNIIRPHFGSESRENRPEPKIKGNTVDLRGDQQN
ncbi:MAG: hypothetical protein WC831_04085 [Parcubacteria group bacterium]|jgi:hypothetical protein